MKTTKLVANDADRRKPRKAISSAPAGGGGQPEHEARWRMLPTRGVGAAGSGGARELAEHAEQVGRELQRVFGQLLRHLPARVGKVAEVARWLDLDRSVCQRVVMGVRDATDGLGVLERFPGVRGLEQFIAAAEA